MKSLFDVKGKVVLVTGGAKGIGLMVSSPVWVPHIKPRAPAPHPTSLTGSPLSRPECS